MCVISATDNPAGRPASASPTATDTYAVELHGITKRFPGVVANKDIELSVRRGTVHALVGENGAGKSTLMRTLAGLVRPTSGQVDLDGEQILGRRAEDIVRAGIALVPEGRSTIPELTVDENLRLGGMWRSRQDRAASRDEVFALFPVLAERQSMSASTLSGGERQQLAIGRALMCDPRCLLLDEPSLGLAPLIIEEIYATINLLKEAGYSILLVEENPERVMDIAGRVYLMDHGQIVWSGKGADMLANDTLISTYLGA